MDKKNVLNFLDNRIEMSTKTLKSCLNESGVFKENRQTKNYLITYYRMMGRIEAYKEIRKFYEGEMNE